MISSRTTVIVSFYLMGAVRRSPLGTQATIGPTVPAKDDDDDDECGAVGAMRNAYQTKLIGENVLQCHYINYKSHMN
jgi:hypothetical protein